MRSNNSNGSRVSWARGFMALFAIVLPGGSGAFPLCREYNLQQRFGDRHGHQHGGGDDPGWTNPEWLAVAPNGKHVYVTNINSANVSVIRTATNTVVATIPVGTFPIGVAVTPDGTHAYVANNGSNNVSVIATATKTVVATVPVGTNPVGVAVTGPGGVCPQLGRRRPKWEARLRHEF